MRKEHFGRLEHKRTIICGKNILGNWNTRGLSYGERTFWAFGTHKDDQMGKNILGIWNTRRLSYVIVVLLQRCPLAGCPFKYELRNSRDKIL